MRIIATLVAAFRRRWNRRGWPVCPYCGEPGPPGAENADRCPECGADLTTYDW